MIEKLRETVENGHIIGLSDVVYKINEIIEHINNCNAFPKRPRKLYAVENMTTKEIIFSARGGAYQDRFAAENKMALLHRENPKFLYRIVEYNLNE